MSQQVKFFNHPNPATEIAMSPFVHNEKETNGSLWLKSVNWKLKRGEPQSAKGFSDTYNCSCNPVTNTIMVRPGLSNFSMINAIVRQVVEALHNSRRVFDRFMPRVNNGEFSCVHVGILVAGNAMLNDFYRFPTMYNNVARELDATPSKYWSYTKRMVTSAPGILGVFKSAVFQCHCQKNPTAQMNRMTSEERQTHFEQHQFNGSNW